MREPPTIPRRVTRFYGTAAFGLDVTSEQRISLIHVAKLNDLFDPYLFFETDFDESRHKLLKYVREYHPADASRFRRHITFESWSKTVEAMKTFLRSWRDHAYVFSTSAESDELHPKVNLYMWGHYGNGHRGIAIEVNAAALGKSLIAHHVKINRTPPRRKNVWTNIEYAK